MTTKIVRLLIGFAFTSFISIAAGNIFLGMATLCFLFYLHKTKRYDKDKFCINKDLKIYYYVYAFFVSTMLLSALCSSDLIVGIRKWADLWIWRWLPFPIITLIIADFAQARKVMLSAIFGLSIGILALIYQGFMGAQRAAGFFGHQMTFAGYLCIFLPILLVCFAQKEILGKYRYASGAMFIFGCFALFFNGTRGAWIATAPVLLVIILYYMFQNKKYATIGLVFLVTLGVYLMNNDRFIKRVSSITNVTTYQSNTERLLMWNSAYCMFKDHPILGVGLGQYTYSYQNKYISPKAKEPNLTHAHSNYMQMLAENGIVGFAGFISLVCYILISNLKDFLHSRCQYSLMIAGSTLALLLQGITEYNFGNSAVMKVYWMTLGCLLVMKSCHFKSTNIK